MLDSDLRARLLLRARGCCERCGTRLDGRWDGMSVHHRQPRGMGGGRRPWTDSPANLLVLCGSGTTGCHGWVESNRFAARRDGLLVSRYADPRETAVLLHGGAWWWLTDECRRLPIPPQESTGT